MYVMTAEQFNQLMELLGQERRYQGGEPSDVAMTELFTMLIRRLRYVERVLEGHLGHS